MRKTRSMIILALTIVMMLGMTTFVNAESSTVNGTCYFNGNDIVCDFDSNKVNDTIRGLEPGDDVTFEVKFTNEYTETTHWYMRNEALATLEQSYDRTENGGYTYILKAGGQTLFNNSAVGGEKVVNKLQGLKQATNATKDYFFIEELKPGKSGTTTLHVELDGETGVNTYMDTQGALSFQYAVEEKGKRANPDNPGTRSRIKTGDMNRIIYYVVLLSAAVLLLVIAVVIWRRDRKRGEDA